jgi:hypothetical protein
MKVTVQAHVWVLKVQAQTLFESLPICCSSSCYRKYSNGQLAAIIRPLHFVPAIYQVYPPVLRLADDGALGGPDLQHCRWDVLVFGLVFSQPGGISDSEVLNNVSVTVLLAPGPLFLPGALLSPGSILYVVQDREPMNCHSDIPMKEELVGAGAGKDI